MNHVTAAGPAATDPCTPVTETATDGARLVMCAHGGQVLGWTPAGGGPSRLWASPLATCGPGAAIRGGVPVVFPQFSDRGRLPKHGLVRDRPWRLRPGLPRTAAARFVATLEDDAATRAVWPQGFRLTVTAQALGDRLDVALDVENTGSQAWSFTAALHAYLAVGDAGRTTVQGLGGRTAEDNGAGRASVTLPPGPLAATGRRDVAVHGATGPVVLDDPEFGRLVVDAEGFTDRVLWNPGEPHGLPDVPPGGGASFVCVEPAALSPVTLAPGALWRGAMRLHASRPSDRPT
ncbi:MAG: D-hexose-6-phosphate mutarotase [Kineosporiaceae bacterium]